MQHVDLGAEEVASKEFPVKFRGFDQHEVRAFLAQVAAELAAARERERLQRERLEAAETRAASMVPTDAEIEAALGQEAGRVLHAAREAAQEIRSRAEEQVARLVRDASGEGSRAQQEAESLLARRTEEAEKVAAEITAEAHRKAEAELERAKAEGREMVAEAQAIRERVLKDLARRRRAAHQQLEQLRAGRERLLEAYRVVRTTLDEATSELSVAEVEARAAAETASLRMGSMPETTVEELEAELSAARDLGIAPASTTLVPRGKAHAANGNGGHLSSGVAVAVPASDEPVDDPAPPDRREPPGPVVEAVPALLDPAPSDADDDIDDVDDVVAEAATEAPAEAVEPVAVAMAVDSEPDADADGPLAEEPAADEVAPEPSTTSDPRSGDRPAVEELFARLRAEQAPGEPSPVAPTPSTPPATAGSVVDDDPTSDDEQLLQRRDTELEPVERTLVRALKRALADEQNEVLDTLRRGRGAASITELLPGASDHTARYLAVVGPALATAAQLGAADEAEAPTVSDLAVGLAAEVAEDVRARLQRALEAADGQEASLSEGFSSAYREWKTSRVEPLARHHCVAAHTRGRFVAARGNLRWVVDGEEGPCPDCDDNALASTPKGDVFPTGQRHPPAHIGCRCTIVGDER